MGSLAFVFPYLPFPGIISSFLLVSVKISVIPYGFAVLLFK